MSGGLLQNVFSFTETSQVSLEFLVTTLVQRDILVETIPKVL